MQNIIAIGATGAGKSTLLDILCGKAGEFVHDSSPSSVTQKCHEYPIPEKKVKLVDAPGQADPDERKEEKNHQELASAIRDGEEQAFLYVIQPMNGRISNTDIESYDRMVKCFGSQPHSIAGVINCDPSAKMSEEERKEYRKELCEELKRRKVEVFEWVFIPELDLKISSAPGGPSAYLSEDVKLASQTLWEAISQVQAEQHRVLQERETAERLAKEQDRLRQKEEEDAKRRVEEQKEKQKELEEKEARERALKEEEERKKCQQEEKERKEREAKEEEARKQEEARKAEQARLQAVADTQIRPVRCSEGSGNPCSRYTHRYTVGYVRQHGVPYWNCKWENSEHCPRVRGW